MAKWVIYGIYDATGLLYVGKTENLEERWKSHRINRFCGPGYRLEELGQARADEAAAALWLRAPNVWKFGPSGRPSGPRPAKKQKR